MKAKKPLDGAAGSRSASTRSKATQPRAAAPAKPAPTPPGPVAGPNRVTTARQYRILEIIQQNPGLTALEICERAHCSESSFFRDLRYLTLDLRIPIEACKQKRNGYTVTKPVLGFASMYLTSSELLSLLLGYRSLAATRNAAFASHMEGAMRKLSVIMTDEISQLWHNLDTVISFRSGAIEVLTDAQVALTVWDAVLAPEEIELLYWKLDAPEATPRTLRPLHLLCMDSAWYLFAHDVHGTDPEPHMYLLSRMRNVRRTGRTFERPHDFDVRQKLAHSIGVFGGEPERLHLRLRGKAARWFGERRIHQTQEFIANEDGSADFTMDVAINPELERLIMGWGPKAEVVAPAKLRAKVAEAGREMWELMRQPVA